MRGSVAALCVAALLAGCAAGPGGAPGGGGQVAPARSAKILFSNAEGHFFRGNYREAVAGYTEAIAADPRHAPAYRCRAAAQAVLGRDAEALADYGRALELDPRYDDAWLGRGLYHFARGRYADAIEDLDRAAALDPRNGVVHKYRAQACEKVGRLREAAAARQTYIHCEAPPEPPASTGEIPPARELKALGLER